MYIPVFKNRLYENKFIREHAAFFDDNVMPLIEILSSKIGRTTVDLVDLLAHYDTVIQSYFLIDFFTFGEKEYSKFDPTQVPFFFQHRNDTVDDYLDLLHLVSMTKNGIPVISIKHARASLLDASSIRSLVQRIQVHSKRIAVRVEASLMQKFFKLLEDLLREEDLLLYDINEESIQSKFFDLKLMSIKTKEFQRIVLHSPRSSQINNGSYLDGNFTGLIDNSLRSNYLNYNFDGFGDYAGLKNVLPTDGGNNKGAALGLFYVNSNNQFFSIMNADTTQGTKGHNYVLHQAIEVHNQTLNPRNNCPAFDYMNKELYQNGKSGSWGQWKYITILRYLSQIKSSL